MIPVAPSPEPSTFQEKCRSRGAKWLETHQDYSGRPKDYWSQFQYEMHEAFGERCGWHAMYIPIGEVDHFEPIALLKRYGRDTLAYEWSNLRYIDHWINKKKGDRNVLDPFDVQEGWFKILLPSLQLRTTGKIPPKLRKLARATVKVLELNHNEKLIRTRRSWFEQYQLGQLNLAGLHKRAPLIAQAVERDLNKANPKDWRIKA